MSLAASTASRVAAAYTYNTTSSNGEDTIIIIHNDSPPPPPLSTVVDTWAPLYFFLGLCAAYAIVMLMVIGSFYWKRGGRGGGEAQPLQKQVAGAFQRPSPGIDSSRAWEGASPEMVQQYMQIDGWVRAAFIRKVYAILSTQLLMTVGICVGLIYASFVHGDPHYPSSFGYWLAGPGYYVSFIAILLSMCTLCGVFSCKNSYPMNMFGLALFTSGISFSISTICVIYYGSGFGPQLLLAFIISTATFLALTVFTIFSKIDFEFLGPILCLGIVVLLIWSMILSIFYMFSGFHTGPQLVFVIFGVVLFVGFIIYDTYMIVNRLSVDDYVVAAIELYLDFINFFLYILQLLTLTSSNR